MNSVSKPTRRSNRSSFVESTLTDINQTLEQSLFADRLARQSGLLQDLDARLKVISLLLLLAAAGFSQNLLVIIALYLLALVLAGLSHLPLRVYIQRVWIAVFVFTGLVGLPAFFLTPGPGLITPFPGITITQTGALSVLFLFLRSGTSVSLATLLILTTPWNTVLKALGVLHLPDVIVLILGMTYRYIHLLLHAASDMFLSRKSRILRKLSPGEERALLSATSGALLGKSLQISSDVYLAMQSRGFRWYPKTLDSFQFHRRDYMAGMTVIMITVTALWLGH